MAWHKYANEWVHNVHVNKSTLKGNTTCAHARKPQQSIHVLHVLCCCTITGKNMRCVLINISFLYVYACCVNATEIRLWWWWLHYTTIININTSHSCTLCKPPRRRIYTKTIYCAHGLALLSIVKDWHLFRIYIAIGVRILFELRIAL